MSVTLQDVAKLAGVSVGTASQALNQSPKVHDATRQRVEHAAETLGYSFKGRRRMPLRERGMSIVGALAKHNVGDPTLIDPFYGHIYVGIEEECRKSGLSLMVSNIEVDLQNRPVEWPAMIDNQLVDGLLFVGAQIEGIADAVGDRLPVPIVLVDSHAPSLPFDAVLTDNVQGAVLAMEHLLGLGHRAIGLIGSKRESVPSVAERRSAYIESLRGRGLFHEAYMEDSELERHSAHRATITLLRRCPQITAIFACNDIAAVGVLAAARDLGLHVPRDLSVVGFDDITLTTEVFPQLTTVHVHKQLMGALGVRFLVERARNPDHPRVTSRLGTDLVVRESTAPPRPAS